MSATVQIEYASSQGGTKLPSLERTQEYLKNLLEGEAPAPLLVAAWEDFYRFYNSLIRRFVVTRGLVGSDVDDCVQEVWTTVVVKLASFRCTTERPGLSAWLYKIVQSKAYDLVRRKLRHHCDSLVDGAQVPQPSRQSGDDDPAAVFAKKWETAICPMLLADLQSRVLS